MPPASHWRGLGPAIASRIRLLPPRFRGKEFGCGHDRAGSIVLLVAGLDRGGDRHVRCELAFGGDVELHGLDRFERAQVVGHASLPDLKVDVAGKTHPAGRQHIGLT